MDGISRAHFAEFEYLLQQRYPDLPLAEAYLRYHQDKLAPFAKESDAIEALVRKLCRPADIASDAGGIIWRIGKNIVEQHSEPNRPNADLPVAEVGSDDISTQMQLEIVKKLMHQTARSDNSLDLSLDTVVTNAALMTGRGSNIISTSTENVVREINGINIIGQSLVDHINYYGRWMQTVTSIQIAQANQAIQALNVISDHLNDGNSIQVSGAGGPDGFAKPVYDYIQKRMNDVDTAELKNHRFFVYHPDTNWYGAFHRMIRGNPLPPEFCAKADNLDTICRFMEDVRRTLIDESVNGKNVVFHLLCPSWYTISIKEPLHFPDSLSPLRVEGEKHKGKELVELNLPAAPAGLLNGVANVLDANGWNNIARGASVATTIPAVGWGINGACLAFGLGVGAVTGLGVFVAMPLWFGTAMPAMGAAAPIIDEAVYNALCEEAPRVLGSTNRLNIPRRYA
ncbi:hypothetical protein N7481_002893 [Penicillium waksmanii]|uniref:uncharacterized protein n=1 Tax=Penicillium waksmanii TaxID=69791 RepID=UPI0025479491|nr:uncharacterized protein N7481_013487 [Penicillium waksmanii]XP_057127044.1 uncharacterized protein N7481_002893 [Penicillium waksmanii]KAJ5963182.1 hypothetical protein N7481_013487 [Penicillium waksmanii]KAJ5995916.1 hypothetical protein N7481_002893 [Penicillium waksmanii]